MKQLIILFIFISIEFFVFVQMVSESQNKKSKLLITDFSLQFGNAKM